MVRKERISSKTDSLEIRKVKFNIRETNRKNKSKFSLLYNQKKYLSS